MLSKIEVTTRQGNLLSLPLEDISFGLTVDDVEGLDPVKATLVSSSFARLDGEQYQSSKRETRNIKLTLGIEPDEATETVAGVRRRVYAYFMPKSQVTLRFFSDDGPSVDIVAIVESCETPLWTQEPTAVVSLMCFDPDFISPTLTTVEGATTSGSDEFTINYDGTVETGIQFVLAVDRSVNDITIYHNPPNDTLRTMEFSAPLLNGDEVTINTVVGQKYATRKRTGVDTSILFGISPQSSWIELSPGPNVFRVYATGAAIPFDINYFTRYGGL